MIKLEEYFALLPKIIELGVLGICNVYLIVKGVATLNDLTNIVKELTAAVERQNESLRSALSRLDILAHDNAEIKAAVNMLLRRGEDKRE